MKDMLIINSIAYVKSEIQPKNKLQALMPKAYWMNPHVTKDHCTGKTTGKLIEFIGKVMQHPNTKFKISEVTMSDHGTPIVYYFVMDELQELLNKLELKFFNLDQVNKTLSYDVHFAE